MSGVTMAEVVAFIESLDEDQTQELTDRLNCGACRRLFFASLDTDRKNKKHGIPEEG